MNKILLKEMSLISLLIGAISGVLVLIPFINLFIFLFLMCFSAVFAYLWLKKNNKVGFFEQKEAASYGGAIGGIAFVSFSIVLIPLSLFCTFINDLWFHKLTWFSFIKTIFSMGITGGTVLIFLIVLLMSVLSAVFNAFFIMIAVAICQSLDDSSKKQNDFKVDVEIK